MPALLADLSEGEDLATLARTAARHVQQLTGAAAAVLLRRVPGDDRHIYVEDLWCADPELGPTLREVFAQTTHATDEVAPDCWTLASLDVLESDLAAWGLGLTVRAIHHSPHAGTVLPTGAFALLDPVAAEGPATLPVLGRALREEVHDEFVTYTLSLLENATRQLARKVGSAVGELPDDAPGPGTLARHLAQQLTGALHLDAVIVALGDRAGVRVVASEPEVLSLTDAALDRGAGTLSDTDRGWVIARLGWEGARGCDVVALGPREAPRGTVIALTRPDGSSLGWHRRLVLRTVAEIADGLLLEARRRDMLEDLNTLARQLAGMRGRSLRRALQQGLTTWAHEHVRAGARVALLTRAHGHQDLVRTAPDDLPRPLLQTLQARSRRWGVSPAAWAPTPDHGPADRVAGLRPEAPDEALAALGPHGLAVPVTLPNAEDLVGHLLLGATAPLHTLHRRALSEAARELAVVVDGERIRHGFMAEAGLFRHALISPLQGMSDAAYGMVDLTEALLQAGPAERAPLQAELDEERQRVRAETARVRRWRTVQRLYGGGLLGGRVILPQRRRQPLLHRVRESVERYRAEARRAHRVVRTAHDLPEGAAVVHDAEALDIIVSNLLDNALKYGFSDTELVVGTTDTVPWDLTGDAPNRRARRAQHDRRWVGVWVEDTGLGLPDDLPIYEPGTRAPRPDVFRSIQGEGLGLRLAQTLAVAHEGRVTHVARALPGAPRRRGIVPHRVRFWLLLPRDDRSR